MDYECTYNSDLDIIEAVTHGTCTLEELSVMRENVLELCREHASANILIDHSDLNAGPLTMNQVRAIAAWSNSTEDFMGKRKCAHLATDLEFGFARVWETLVGLSGRSEVSTMSFTSRDSAVEWLTNTL